MKAMHLILTALVACTAILGGTSVMAQTREAAASTAAATLYNKIPSPVKLQNEPELSAISEKFIYNDIQSQVKLPVAKQELLTIVVLTANNTPEDIPAHVEGAIKAGATAGQVHESVFHCTPYVGLPKVKAALERVNKALELLHIKTPCEAAGTTTDATRYEAGLAVQKAIFGEAIDKMNASAPADQKHINYNLSANCFGDYYTRNVLDIKERELVTFTAIATLGGCEPQAKAHANANIAVGNTRQDLLDAITIALPYIGYPRTLNALGCINAVAPAK